MPSDTIFTLINILQDEASRAIAGTLRRLAGMDMPILISGETGVGKDTWVRFLRGLSPGIPFLDLNCGDVPENLLESEWFGYRKGAFTGANTDFPGKWLQAEGGILYLDQIDLLSLNLQSKLLRIVERRKYYSLGSNTETDFNARMIFSTDDHIEDRVREGKFRADLYYRISPCKIHVPPLRDRKRDILPLLNHFASRAGLAVHLSSKGIHRLLHHPWRGNIRELANLITNTIIRKSSLEDDDLERLVTSAPAFLDMIGEQEMSLREMERQYIRFLLAKHKSKVKVAKILKIARKSLYNKINQRDTKD